MADWTSFAIRLYANDGKIVVWSKDDLPKDSELFQTVFADDWDAAKKIAQHYTGYAYRGHSCVDWGLSTAFERALDRAQPRDSRGRWFAHQGSIEQDMLYEFKRRAKLYEQNLPEEGELLEWLSLMQHYGCPTRLLDFSWSFYVAAFFAICEADLKRDIAIWGISPYMINDALSQKLMDVGLPGSLESNQDRIAALHNIVENESSLPGILLVEPYKLNDRISAQQGVFAVPTDITKPFIENLMHPLGVDYSEGLIDSILSHNTVDYEYFDKNASLDIKAVLYKIVLPANEQYEIRRDLKRMNITYETLFPGLEGYTRSLVNLLYQS